MNLKGNARKRQLRFCGRCDIQMVTWRSEEDHEESKLEQQIITAKDVKEFEADVAHLPCIYVCMYV
jgi:hypothetical protein